MAFLVPEGDLFPRSVNIPHRNIATTQERTSIACKYKQTDVLSVSPITSAPSHLTGGLYTCPAICRRELLST